MIYGSYLVEPDKNSIKIRLSNSPKVEEPWKLAKSTFHVENAISKYYSASVDKTSFDVFIVISQDSQYLNTVGQLLKTYVRGVDPQLKAILSTEY